MFSQSDFGLNVSKQPCNAYLFHYARGEGDPPVPGVDGTCLTVDPSSVTTKKRKTGMKTIKGGHCKVHSSQRLVLIIFMPILLVLFQFCRQEDAICCTVAQVRGILLREATVSPS